MRQFISTLAALLVVGVVKVSASNPIQTLFVPLPEEDLYNRVFKQINSNARAPVKSLVSLSVSTDRTVVYYDHWEDGYDEDVTGNKQGSTQVWGDGDWTNGCAPKVDPGTGNVAACDARNPDTLDSGDVCILESTVKLYSGVRRASEHRYDGGDIVQATLPIAMTRAAYPSSPGSLMAGAVEVIEQKFWGTNFEAPIGYDVSSNRDIDDVNIHTSAYQLSRVAVMCGTDGTVVKKNGSTQATLDKGESKMISIQQGDKITTSEPCQVHMITGDKGSNYELRWYFLAPTDQWYTEAYAPVGDTEGEVRITVYNPASSQINVVMTTLERSRTMTIPAGEHRVSPILKDSFAAKFSSSDGKFYAFSSTDTEGSGQIFDWGYPLVGKDQLTEQVIVGLGYGCEGNRCGTTKGRTGERSIVWVTCTEDCTIYADYDNDGTADHQVTARALESHEFTDDNDEDMSGANIWAVDANGDGVKVAAAWGQKAAYSISGDSYGLDLGTVVVPFPTTRSSCSVSLENDRDNDGEISVGDRVKQKIEVINVGQMPLDTNSFIVQTPGGPVVVDKALDGRGDTQIYYVEYDVPEGYDVKENCDLIPYKAELINQPPVAEDDYITTPEDTPLAIQVLENDSDPEGTDLTTMTVGSCSDGSAVVNGDNTVTYTPPPGFHGDDVTCPYTIEDEGGETAAAVIHIDVTGVNDPPVAEDDTATTPEDTPVTIEVLVNDSDPDGDPLTVTDVGNDGDGSCSVGSAAVNSDNTVTYTPPADFHGTATCPYTIADGNGGFASAVIDITVTGVNDPPVAVDDYTSTPEDTPVTIAVLKNDSDPEDDPLTTTNVGSCSDGSAKKNDDNTVTYTPPADFQGTATCPYTISDGNGGFDTATIYITVTTTKTVDETPKKGGSSGDPHFKTWTGAKYDYHGECDLVLVDNPSFNNGQGLKVHIRTTRVKYFSFIETIALQIGSDILEFDNDVENFMINGMKPESNQKHHKTKFAGFVVRRDRKAISVRLSDQLVGGAKIDFHTRKNGFPAVIVDAGHTDAFQGSLGLLGEFGTGRTLARDGVTEIAVDPEDASAFALEWQVRDTDPMLFSEYRSPQFPQTCTPPKKMIGTRLGMAHAMEEAKEACAHWKQDMDDCIFDVMATQDVLVALEGHIVHVE